MLVVETIAKIRRAYFQQQKPIKQICRELRVSRKASGEITIGVDSKGYRRKLDRYAARIQNYAARLPNEYLIRKAVQRMTVCYR